MEDEEANAWIEKHFIKDKRRGRKLARKFCRLTAKICTLNRDALKEFNKVTDNVALFCGGDISTAKINEDGEDLTRN